MNLYICYDFGKIDISTTAPCRSLYEKPADFLLAIFRGETAYYSGSIRSLRAIVNDPFVGSSVLTDYQQKCLDDLKKLLPATEDFDYA